MVGIYRITSPSGKVYIGQSWNIHSRKGAYRRGECKRQVKIYESIKKYGWSKHQFDTLQGLPEDVTQESLDQLEIYIIQQYKDCNYKMLNIQYGGNGGKLGEETKKKIGDYHRGKIMSEESKLKMSLSGKGRIKTEETRRLLSIANTGKKLTEEQKKKMSINRLGKKRGDQKIKVCPVCGKQGGASMMVRWHFDNCGVRIPMKESTKEKLRICNIGKKYSNETNSKKGKKKNYII